MHRTEDHAPLSAPLSSVSRSRAFACSAAAWVHNDVLAVLTALDAGGIDYWVDGGWGIDALVGEQTRRHHELDLGVSRDDVARVEALLPQFRRESEEASFYTDERGHAVDLMLVDRTQGGQVQQQLPEGGQLRYAQREHTDRDSSAVVASGARPLLYSGNTAIIRTPLIRIEGISRCCLFPTGQG